MAPKWDPSRQNFEAYRDTFDPYPKFGSEPKDPLQELIKKVRAEKARVQVLSPNWRSQHEALFFEQVKQGLYKQMVAPVYDTLVMDGRENVLEQNAFIAPLGQGDGFGKSKTLADTNMVVGACLPTPTHGYWSQLRVHFERYTGIEDAMEWKEKASIKLLVNNCEVKWLGTLGTMEPILPKGGQKIIDRKIKRGVIRFWPWYEGQITPILIQPLEMFSVQVSYKGGISPKNPMRLKISLGPFMYSV